MLAPKDCCVLNGGQGAWAFEPLAHQLSAALGIDISAEPREFNYLLQTDLSPESLAEKVFIPLPAIKIASDKRLIAREFLRSGVPAPHTELLETFDDVRRFLASHPALEWCLKYPTGCGASGHQLLHLDAPEPLNWPRPFVVQEFIRLTDPEVFRIYCAGGELFGWMARRFPAGREPSPWVAHARGARYANLGSAPPAARVAARQALVATGLLASFGCADLLRRPSGEWLVLEVGTDGLFNHVDRELDDAAMEAELLQRIRQAFWASLP